MIWPEIKEDSRRSYLCCRRRMNRCCGLGVLLMTRQCDEDQICAFERHTSIAVAVVVVVRHGGKRCVMV
jgi:hypothetical protein